MKTKIIVDGVTYVQENPANRICETRDLFCCICGHTGPAIGMRTRTIPVDFAWGRFTLMGHTRCLEGVTV